MPHGCGHRRRIGAATWGQKAQHVGVGGTVSRSVPPLADHQCPRLDQFLPGPVDGVHAHTHLSRKCLSPGVTTALPVRVLRSQESEKADGMARNPGVQQPLGEDGVAPDIRSH